jgi:hypothetical protein
LARAARVAGFAASARRKWFIPAAFFSALILNSEGSGERLSEKRGAKLKLVLKPKLITPTLGTFLIREIAAAREPADNIADSAPIESVLKACAGDSAVKPSKPKAIAKAVDLKFVIEISFGLSFLEEVRRSWTYFKAHRARATIL